MGHGGYSQINRLSRATTEGYFTKSTKEIFKSSKINEKMNPYGVQLREARDSQEHPESLGIIIALDLTGSMGEIPPLFIKDGLPTIVSKIMQAGILDPQILFMGIGDHSCDSAPLQIGQFECSDQAMDYWLQNIYLEGGGGGNEGESYLLSWFFANRYTAMDCLEKRNKKGFLFTIGDEPSLTSIPKETLQKLMGPGEYSNVDIHTLYAEVQKKYNVFHLHIKETMSGQRDISYAAWVQLMQDHCLFIESYKDIPDVIATTIITNYIPFEPLTPIVQEDSSPITPVLENNVQNTEPSEDSQSLLDIVHENL